MLGEINMEPRMIFGLFGSIFLILGAFAPAFTSAMGSFTLIKGGQGDGVGFVVLGSISLALSLASKYRWIWATAIPATILLAVDFVDAQQKISQAHAKLAGNPFAIMGRIEMSWAWPVLVLGVLGLFIAAAYKKRALAAPAAALLLLIPSTGSSADRIDVLGADGDKVGELRLDQDSGTADIFDAQSNREGWGTRRQDGSWNLYNKDGSRRGYLQPGRPESGQPGRLILTLKRR